MFRIGTTSYILPADILPNVEYLATRVADVQLVLFETDEYGSNLPDAALCDRLNALAAAHGLTYTVHLPLDLRLGDGGEATHVSLVKAQRVIEATRALEPFAYTLHLDGRALLLPEAEHPERSGRVVPATQSKGAQRSFAKAASFDFTPQRPRPAADVAEFRSGCSDTLSCWQANARRALEIVCGWLDAPERLCIENVERWDPEAFAPIVEALPVSRTIDIGHLWLQGVDPLVHLARWVDRARVIHIHGIAARDHASLAHVPPERLDPVIALLAERFTGVVTLEVFNEADLASSQAALAASLARHLPSDPLPAREGGARSPLSSQERGIGGEVNL